MMPEPVPFDFERAKQVVSYLQYENGAICRFTMRVFIPQQNAFMLCELYSAN